MLPTLARRQFGPALGGGINPPLNGGTPPFPGAIPPFLGPIGPFGNPLTSIPDFLSSIFKVPGSDSGETGQGDDDDSDDDDASTGGDDDSSSPGAGPGPTESRSSPPHTVASSTPSPTRDPPNAPTKGPSSPPYASTTAPQTSPSGSSDVDITLAPSTQSVSVTADSTDGFSFTAEYTDKLASPSAPASPALAGKARFPAAAIGIIATVVALALIFGLFLFLKRRRRRSRGDAIWDFSGPPAQRQSTMIESMHTGSTMPYFVSAAEAGVKERRAERSNPFAHAQDEPEEDPFVRRSWRRSQNKPPV